MKQKIRMIFGRPIKLMFAAWLLIVLSLACNLPVKSEVSGQQKPAGNIETSIAETMIALVEDVGEDIPDQSESEPEPDQEDLPPTDTATPENTDTPTFTPTFTLTPTITDTPTITETPTPEVAMVYVSENTNCRTGPGTIYDWLTTISQGQEVEAIARSDVGDYWYVKRPDPPNSPCYLWGKYATPTGPHESLPVFTPPPTPTPIGFDFTISYYNYLDCNPIWALQYRVDNVGSKTIESWQTTAVDHTGGSNPFDSQSDIFYEFDACAPVNVQVDLTSGEAYYVIQQFHADPKGHDITTKITLCRQDGLGGKCLTKNYRHTP
jgi:hypothetical protein